MGKTKPKTHSNSAPPKSKHNIFADAKLSKKDAKALQKEVDKERKLTQRMESSKVLSGDKGQQSLPSKVSGK